MWRMLGVRVPRNLTPWRAFLLSAAIMVGMFAFMLVIFIASAAFCYWHQGFDVRYVKNTDQLLCTAAYPEDAPQRRQLYCDGLPVHDEITYSHGYCDRPEEIWSVLVSVGFESRWIYESPATCEEWQQNDVTITVEQTGGRYSATEPSRHDE